MKKLSLLVLSVMLFWLGCAKEESVSPNAKKVLEAMMTCPNPDLFTNESAAVIGDEGVGNNEAGAKEWERIEENWKEQVGDCISEEYFEKFFSTVAMTYYTESEASGEPISIASMELEEKGEITELVRVNLKKGDDTEEQVSILFTYDSEGKIQKIEAK